MRITQLVLRGYKKFRFAKIKELTCDLQEGVNLICGSNGFGKSSALGELNPLPPIRTDFEAGGYKRLNIEHNGHYYEVISDFSNKSAPHHFILDGTELNVSGTSLVQEELAATHFGVTPAITKLIYNKIQLCNTTKAERKQLFLNINPLELGLILDNHKKALSKVKDTKATLQHLFSRKTDIEGKLIPADVLVQHKESKEKLNNEILAIDKITYALEQHISHLKSTFSEDLQYRQQCIDRNQPLVAGKTILDTCKEINLKSLSFGIVARGEEFNTEFTKHKQKQAEIAQKQQNISSRIRELSDEINEYHKHMDASTERPPSKVEAEIKEVEEQLKKYPNIPTEVIAPAYIPQRRECLDTYIQPLLFYFRDLEKPMIPPTHILKIREKVSKLQEYISSTSYPITQISTSIERIKAELLQLQQDTNIPKDCTSKNCGLRQITVSKKDKLEEDLKKLSSQLKDIISSKERAEKCVGILASKISYYNSPDAVDQYNKLGRYLLYNFPIEDWSKVLLDKLTQPLLIYKQLDEYIELSKLAEEVNKLTTKKKELQVELEALIKSNATSVGFLKKQLDEKEKQVKKFLSELTVVDKELEDTNKICALYLEYQLATEQVKSFQQQYEKGEKALLVNKAIGYWEQLWNFFVEGKKVYSEELRKIESIVREQDILRATYNSEILKSIEEVSERKLYYEHIEMALSPTTGMPHKSMVKYLNALINNVNYFLSEIWSYHMKILPISEENPVDYGFPIEIGGVTNGDISMTSDGQKEVINFAWVLTILLQMKLLDKIPFFGDELGRAMDSTHRLSLLQFLGRIMENKLIDQLFLVNHYADFADAFKDCNTICLSPEAMGDLPVAVNEHTQIVRY